ncbi:Hypothetical protein A7982_02267 [Minicystis rosea]|nr:Hypothetical protein A7982_02267 [Minicystis rosea]
MDRHHWARYIEGLDPEREHQEIYRVLTGHEFYWDINQALSLALFRTYAIPSIGRLLFATGEFTGRTQKRYEDTTLILETILENGFSDPRARTAVRRMNQMHGAYDITNEDMLYVLSTFVVTPVRWIDDFGFRKLTEAERRASTNYYRELGRHMGIKGILTTYAEFAAHMDAYEREHFAFDEGARAIADATLDHMTTLPINRLAPKALTTRMAMAVMDDPLLTALRYPLPSPAERRAARAALRLRARVVRMLPPRREPMNGQRFGSVRGYRDGYDVSQLGTFPRGCPVPHRKREAAPVDPE